MKIGREGRERGREMLGENVRLNERGCMSVCGRQRGRGEGEG